MEDLTGRRLGAYEIVSPLGEGGMASVYKAYQRGMERHVAIKILPRHLATDPLFVRRFQREARVIANLQHAHILPVHDFGQVNEYFYLIMPFMETGTLAEELGRGPLPLERTQMVISQIGDALGYAHSKAVVHRDVKPKNILLDSRGNCLLTDFGIAKPLEAETLLTQTGEVIGTPAYMSPEQIRGERLDGRSDIYSLGIILFEMATGQRPFEGGSSSAVMVKHLHDPVPSPRGVCPDVPEEVEKAIFRALEKDPAERYQTTAEMIREVRGAPSRRQPQPVPVERPAALPVPPIASPPRGGETLHGPAPFDTALPLREARVPRVAPRRLRALVFILGGTVAFATLLAGAFVLAGVLGESAGEVPAPSTTAPATVAAQVLPTKPPSPEATIALPPEDPDVRQFVELDRSDRGFDGSMRLDPSGKRIVMREVSSGALVILDSSDLQEVSRIQWEGSRPGRAGWAATAWSPDGTRLVAGGLGGILTAWEVESGRQIWTTTADRPLDICSLTWSTDGSTIYGAYVNSGAILRADAMTGEMLPELRGRSAPCPLLALSGDGRRLARTIWESIEVWDTASSEMIRTVEGQPGLISSLAWSADGSRLASVNADHLLVWDVEAGVEDSRVYRPEGDLWSVAWSPGGRWLALGTSSVYVTEKGPGGEITDYGNTGGLVLFWEIGGDRPTMELQETYTVGTLQWSEDGKRIFSGTFPFGSSRGGNVAVWGTP